MADTFTVVSVVLGGLLIVLASGLWIALGLAGIGLLVFYLYLPPSMLRMVEVIPYNILNDFILGAIPLFIFMGSLLYKGDIARRIYQSLGRWAPVLPGGLLQTNIMACGIFGACSGSSLAGAATIGTVAVDELRQQGYNRKLIYGSLAAGGTLATMIPPSILFIIYGAFAGQSVAKLFIAGILPGLLLMLLFMLYIGIKAVTTPDIAPKRQPLQLKAVVLSLVELWPALLLIVAVLGSIYTGIATPTESAAMGTFGALLVLAVDRNLRWSVVKEAAVMAVRTTCMISLMMIGAQILSMGLSVLQVPASISQYIGGLGLEPWQIAVMVGLFFVVLGCFIEGTSMFFLTFPVIYPMMMDMGFNPIWFGVMMALFIEISLITPPVGLNLFIIHQVSGEKSMRSTIQGALPFFFLMLLLVGLLIAFPSIVLFLPSLL